MAYVDLYYPGEIVEETTFFLTPNPRQRYKSKPAYYELAEENDYMFEGTSEEMDTNEFGTMNNAEEAIDISSEVRRVESCEQQQQELEPILNISSQAQEHEQEENTENADRNDSPITSQEESELELELSVSAKKIKPKAIKPTPKNVKAATTTTTTTRQVDEVSDTDESISDQSEATTTFAPTTSAPYYQKLTSSPEAQQQQPRQPMPQMPPINFIEFQEPSITFVGFEEPPVYTQSPYHRRSFFNYPRRPLPRMVPRDRFRMQQQCYPQPTQFPGGCNIGSCGYDCGNEYSNRRGGYNPDQYR